MRNIDLRDFQIATSETARDINRRILLNLIRVHEPVSRAELSRYSGLQRSTVSSIMGQLIAEQWIVEGAMGNSLRGRRPTHLHLNRERAAMIGVDIRPLRTTVALASLDARVIAEDSLRTGSEPEPFVEDLARRIRSIMDAHADKAYEGIGVALPGRVDLRSQKLVFAPNLGWKDVDIKSPLEAATGLPVEVENAANACALAELWSGRHGDGIRDLAAVTVSEGIGVGMILNGQLVRGRTGLAGEFGHVTLVQDGPLCRCGNRGCWEACASNTAAVRYYRESPGSVEGVETLEDVLRLAREGDLHARAAIERMAHHLGAGIVMLVTGFAPDVVVVCGEIAQAWEHVGEVVDEVLALRLPTPLSTRVVPSELVTQPRLRGVIALMLQKHFSAPLVA